MEAHNSIQGVSLARVNRRHAATLFQLVDANRDHLSNLEWAATCTQESIVAYVHGVNSDPSRVLWGIFVRTSESEPVLVGLVETRLLAPGEQSLGYWIGYEHSGHGYIHKALQILMTTFVLGRDMRVLAMTHHGNLKSQAVLKRAGFVTHWSDTDWIYFERPLFKRLPPTIGSKP